MYIKYEYTEFESKKKGYPNGHPNCFYIIYNCMSIGC